jgi:transposase
LNVGLKALLDGQIDVALREVAQRALREFRKKLALAGSDAGGHRAAAIYTLIETCLCRARHKPAR